MKHLDKLLHIAAGAACAALGLLADGPAAGLALAVTVGLAREVWNRFQQGTKFDLLDWLATALGGVAMVAAAAAFT